MNQKLFLTIVKKRSLFLIVFSLFLSSCLSGNVYGQVFSSTSDVFPSETATINDVEVTSSSSFYVDASLKSSELLHAVAKEEGVFHIFSHGRSGALFINNKWLNPQEIVSWLLENDKISSYQSINIYGCNFAKGVKGLEAVSYIEKSLGVNVAASNNITGKSGDWKLEIGGSELPGLEDYNYSLQEEVLVMWDESFQTAEANAFMPLVFPSPAYNLTFVSNSTNVAAQNLTNVDILVVSERGALSAASRTAIVNFANGGGDVVVASDDIGTNVSLAASFGVTITAAGNSDNFTATTIANSAYGVTAGAHVRQHSGTVFTSVPAANSFLRNSATGAEIGMIVGGGCGSSTGRVVLIGEFAGPIGYGYNQDGLYTSPAVIPYAANAADYNRFYLEVVAGVQCCDAGTNAPTLSVTTLNNVCPATTADLTTITASNTPAGTSLTWHTATPATTANLVPTETAVAAGTYYTAFYDATNDCYSGGDGSATTSVTVTITTCCDAGTDGPKW